MTPDDVQERMEAFGYGSDDAADLQQYFHYFQMQSIAPLDTAQGGQMLMGIVHTFEADLVVIDTMTMLVQGDEQSSNTYRDFDRFVSVPLKHEERSLVRLDHMGKNGDMRGSSHKAGYVDLVWKLEKKHDLRSVSVPLKHEERSLVRLDHMGKNGDMRGSSHKAGYVDLVWKLEKKHDL